MTLYRQYRPLLFRDLIGQESVSRTLRNALAKERIAHAYLFSGPRGTGKTTTARIFARSATCENPTLTKEGIFEPCNVCPACESILNGQAPDILEIDAASNRGIEDIRSLREQVMYPPLRLKRKVYIIDEVHMLTGEAFNALLKTLEEPPEHCLFLLATTELHKVPPTVRSRCQLIRFQRGSQAAIQQKLDQIIKSEKWNVEPGVSELIARHADGGFRDAETLLEYLAAQYTPLTVANTIDDLGIVSEEYVNKLSEALIAQNSPVVSSLLNDESHPSAARVEHLLTALIETTRERLRSEKRAEEVSRYGEILGELLEAYILHKHAPDPALPLQVACLRIASSTRTRPTLAGGSIAAAAEPASHTVSQPLAQQAALSKPKETAAAIPVTPVIKETPVVPVVELREETEYVKDVRKAWKAVVTEVARQSAPLAQMLREAVIHTAESGRVTLLMRYKFHLEKVREKKNLHLVEGMLEEKTGSAWKLDYILSENLPKHRPNRVIEGGATPQEAAAVFSSK